jgi:molybdopterin molybdotransferase
MADEAILSRLAVLPAESLPLQQCIGQTLRQDVFAERDNPPFDRVCMDGIAIASAAYDRGVRRFRIESTQAAGAPAVQLGHPDNAIEVMTGAMLPRGTDCIIPLEEYDLLDEMVVLKSAATARSLRNIQRRGEDSERRLPMLTAGTLLRAPELAVAASAGLAYLSVTRPPRVIAISTGDELVEPGEPILEYQIRRSNAYAIVGALRQRGHACVSSDHLKDNEQTLADRLTQHLSTHDVLVLSGGISKGKFDLVPKVLAQIGVQQVFREVAQRPGTPVYFGLGPRGQAVFGLPGNPVATLMSLIRYVNPALVLLSGRSVPPAELMPLGASVSYAKVGMTYFLPVTVTVDERDGTRVGMPAPPKGSGDFLSLARTDGFVELPPPGPFAPGFVARFYRW